MCTEFLTWRPLNEGEFAIQSSFQSFKLAFIQLRQTCWWFLSHKHIWLYSWIGACGLIQPKILKKQLTKVYVIKFYCKYIILSSHNDFLNGVKK